MLTCAIRALGQHPNIVRLLDVLHTKEQLYIVQDYVPNGDLRAALRDHHPVPEKMVRPCALVLLGASCRAHSHKMHARHRRLGAGSHNC